MMTRIILLTRGIKSYIIPDRKRGKNDNNTNTNTITDGICLRLFRCNPNVPLRRMDRVRSDISWILWSIKITTPPGYIL